MPPESDNSVLLWYCAGTVFAIWNVFQSNGLDVRLLALGGILPVLIDAPLGAQRVGHSLLAPVVLMAVVMLSTPGRGRRLVRRRLIAVPIGWMSGTALSGAFTNQRVFWWPAFGRGFGNASVFPPLSIAIGLELVGLGAARWCWVRFGLRDPKRRSQLLRTGRVVASQTS